MTATTGCADVEVSGLAAQSLPLNPLTCPAAAAREDLANCYAGSHAGSQADVALVAFLDGWVMIIDTPSAESDTRCQQRL